MTAMEMDLCNQFEDLNCNQLQDLDCENNKPIYFAGFYNLWKNNNVIFTYYFIFEKEMSERKTEKKIWKIHYKDFEQNRFSELNQSIGDIYDIEVQIIESHYFNKESYEEIESSLQDELKNYQQCHQDNGINVQKNRKDNYNMNDLSSALDNAILMDELFGGED